MLWTLSTFTRKAFIAASCHGRGLLVRPTLLGVSILVSLSVVWLLLKIFVYLVIVTRYFPSRVLMTFSLCGHRHLLRNVIRTAVGCDCVSYS